MAFGSIVVRVVLACGAFVCLLSLADAGDQELRIFKEPHWIDFSPHGYDPVRRSVDAQRACKKDKPKSAKKSTAKAKQKYDTCLKAYVKNHPIVYSQDLYEEPSASSKKVGKLRVEANADDVLSYSFAPVEGKAVPLTLDVRDDDSSFEPLHTVLAKKGSWYQLPRRPFPIPVWMDTAAPSPFAQRELRPITAVGVVEVMAGTSKASVVFDEIREETLIGHYETAEDTPCDDEEEEESQDAPVAAPKPLQMPMKSLFDEDGHVRARIKYTRGC